MDAKLAAKIICDGQDAAAIDACAAEYEALQTSAEAQHRERLCRSDHRSSRHQKICDRCIRDAVHQTGGRSCQKARHSLRKEAVSYEKIFAAVRYGDLPDRYSRVRQSRPGAGESQLQIDEASLINYSDQVVNALNEIVTGGMQDQYASDAVISAGISSWESAMSIWVHIME